MQLIARVILSPQGLFVFLCLFDFVNLSLNRRICSFFLFVNSNVITANAINTNKTNDQKSSPLLSLHLLQKFRNLLKMRWYFDYIFSRNLFHTSMWVAARMIWNENLFRCAIGNQVSYLLITYAQLLAEIVQRIRANDLIR